MIDFFIAQKAQALALIEGELKVVSAALAPSEELKKQKAQRIAELSAKYKQTLEEIKAHL